MIDQAGFRLNVGIILFNEVGKLLWCRRAGNQRAWQFPQGGIQVGENANTAMYRELNEELGLLPEHVAYVEHTHNWHYYRLPKRFIRHQQKPLCIGQKQKWFLLRFTGPENCITLNHAGKPEFDLWRWVDYWLPVKEVIDFKQDVYRSVLDHFKPIVSAQVGHGHSG